jgi:hypothetical protein
MVHCAGDTTVSGPTTGADLAIQILHVPDCPNVETLRNLVQRSLATLGLIATIEQIEGPCLSPTLLINGVDVTSRPGNVDAACRLDLPTKKQILEALTPLARCERMGLLAHRAQG